MFNFSLQWFKMIPKQSINIENCYVIKDYNPMQQLISIILQF